MIQNNKMVLKCPNSNDFLFIGQTQYGVASKPLEAKCEIQPNDCLVSVDYLASQCNGLNSCDIQLDAQFLHTCKNLSDYLSIAYECIPGSKRVDICSNEEAFIIDSTLNEAKTDLNTRFGSFYLASPNYPWEYDSNSNNCSCRLEYVEIDGNQPINNEMNMVFKSYEFDLEDGENNKCNKDKLSIEGDNQTQELCGQHQDFKQFYAKGQTIKLNFTSDDVITRRGFLLEIAPVVETVCPYGTVRFDENKCIKYFDNQHLTHKQASRSCERKQGRLLKINDFVDNLKLSSFIREGGANSEDVSVWADYIQGKQKKTNLNFLNLKKRRHAASCVARKSSFWTEESCYKRRPYICEFDAISQRKNVATAPAQKKNKLIRVSCGDLRHKFTNTVKPAASTTVESTTTTTQAPLRTEKKKTEKPILLWSSLVENFPKKEQPKIASTTTENTKIDFDAYLQDDNTEEEIKSVYEEADSEIITSQQTSKDEGTLSQSLVLTIAIVSGFAIVFIVINIFCIWNYYNKKLNAFIEKNDPENSTYRTSTMRSSTRARQNQANNRSLSTVDSYIKIMPYNTVEACLLGSDGSSNSGSTSPTSQTSQRLENELKLEMLRNYFQQQQQKQKNGETGSNQQNFYETISAHGAAPFQYQSAMVPSYGINQDSINSAVQLLLSQQLQQQIYDQVTYSDLSPTLSMNSQRPLLTFNSTNSSGSKQLATVLDSDSTTTRPAAI